MSVKNNFIEDLPQEVSTHVLSYLDKDDLARFCLVSKKANQIASDDGLWKKLVPGIPLPAQGVKAHLDRYAVGSLLDVVDRVEAFSHMVPWNHSGSFTCYFPFNPGATVQIDLGEQSPKVYKDICVCMKKVFDAHGRNETKCSNQDFEDLTGSTFTVILPEDMQGNGRFFAYIQTHFLKERRAHELENWNRILILVSGILGLLYLS